MLEIVDIKKIIYKLDDITKIFSKYINNFDILKNIENNPYTKYFILFKDNIIIGMINFDVIYDRCELININVIDNEQGNGYGNKLLEFMLKYNKNILNYSLEVRIDNFKAISLYKKYGFEIVAVRKKYYNGIDGYLMIKEFK